MTDVRVLFAGGGSGGHLYPGLAIARALVRIYPRARPFFIGARRGVESYVLPTTEFPFELLDLHPLYRQRPWENWRTLRGAASAWREISRIAAQPGPTLCVGTGGYAAGVAMTWAWAHRIPVVQHIGDSRPGLTAQLTCRISTEAYLGYQEATKYLPRGHCVFRDTGNPIDPPPAILPDAVGARIRWGFRGHSRVLLVFGGSQGSRAMNEIVARWVTRGLPEGLCLIWATGKGSYDTFKGAECATVKVVPYLSPISDAYAASDLALVRGGMMSTSELCAWGIPMIICPLPTAAHDHQTSNARALEAAGAAVHLPQKEMTAERLDQVVRGLLADPGTLVSLRKGALARARPNAAVDIAGHIAALLEKRTLLPPVAY